MPSDIETRTRALTRDVLTYLESAAPSVESALSTQLMDDGVTSHEGASRVLVVVLATKHPEPVPSVVGLFAAFLWTAELVMVVGGTARETLDEIEAWLRTLLRPPLAAKFAVAAKALRELHNAIDETRDTNLAAYFDMVLDAFDEAENIATAREATP